MAADCLRATIGPSGAPPLMGHPPMGFGMGGTPPEDNVEAELVLEREWVDMVDQKMLDMAVLMVLKGAA
jgi:hypothetical protein